MKRNSRGRRLGAAAMVSAALVSVAACGTTVRNAHAVLSQRANEGFDGSTQTLVPTLITPSGTTSTSGTTQAPGSTTTLGPTTPVTSGATTPTQAAISPTTGGGSRRPTASAQPSTPAAHVYKGPAKLAPVEIGIVYSGDLGAFAKLFGGSDDLGNLQLYSGSAINYINKHGGLAGHVLDPVYYSIPLTSTQPYSTTMAAICSSWTQDHHVAAGIAVGFAIPNDLAACLSAHHIPYLSGGTYLHDASSYRQIPYLVSPYEAGTDQAISALIKQMLARHWLSSKSRVGVMLGTNETAATDAYNNIIVPELKGKVASVTSYGIAYPPSTQAAVTETQTVSNDQLHARANGVTNMLFLAPGTEGSFIDDAYQQHWYPKYALTSYDAPWGLASEHNKEVLAALAGSIGIGWLPTSDVGTYGSSVFTNSTTRLCAAIEKNTGQLTDNIREFAAYQYCDALLWVQAATNASGVATITGTSILDGFNALGTSHPSANTFTARITPQQHDGASAYRVLTFDTGCRCFHYTGPVQSF